MVSKIYTSFDRLLAEVNRLYAHPDWLPTERCQISFYYQQLSSLSNIYQILEISYQPEFSCLHILVNRILEYKNVRQASVDYFNDPDPPDLSLVGDQLAFEVAKIFDISMNGFGKASPEFASKYFHFDKNKHQEQVDGEIFVGFHVEASNLLQQLASISRRKLEVISIVGMAGLGKTTLATRLYNDSYIVSYFYVRSWITISQVYHKRDLLLDMLRSVVDITDEVCVMNDNMLAHLLYRALMGRRYLIVIDDIWSHKAWDDIKICFPDDNNGSKVLLTTRFNDVALHAEPGGNPLCLRFLTEEESLDLLRRKALITVRFFDYMSSIGKSIIRKCCGLPLAIVVIAGLLKNNLERDWWLHVAESVSSYIVTSENQCINTLTLSYNHLPQHLRPCFLCFGAFPEDHEIPVHKLIFLWIAEGFIHVNGTNKILEDVAEDYLMDLISRSLVVVCKKGLNGSIKTCRIHDLLRDMCLSKAEEINFSSNMYNYNKHSFSCSHSLTSSSTKSQLSLSTNVVLTIPPSCSCYSSEVSHTFFKEVSIIWDTSKLIRSLDISSIELFVFPAELLQLVHLRYLELRFRSGNLRNLYPTLENSKYLSCHQG